MSPDPSANGSALLIARQREHWEATFRSNPQMYGTEPSEPGRYAASRLASEGLVKVLELGAGQGRDTLGLLAAGLEVTALDYAADSLAEIATSAAAEGFDRQFSWLAHDVRRALPLADASFDACYSHMLFTMALTTDELTGLADEVRRVLRPGGLCVYTVRHAGDAHFGAGRDLGDNLYENGGFVVHFFDRPLVDRLARGFELVEVTAFDEGSLPRRLWRITMRRSQPGSTIPTRTEGTRYDQQ